MKDWQIQNDRSKQTDWHSDKLTDRQWQMTNERWQIDRWLTMTDDIWQKMYDIRLRYQQVTGDPWWKMTDWQIDRWIMTMVMMMVRMTDWQVDRWQINRFTDERLTDWQMKDWQIDRWLMMAYARWQIVDRWLMMTYDRLQMTDWQIYILQTDWQGTGDWWCQMID